MRNDSNNWKKRLGMVYSTNPDFDYIQDTEEAKETPEPGKQTLYVSLDRKQRKGKVVTLIKGFVGTEDNLNELGKELKKKCGTGGSAKLGEIIIQGDFKKRIGEILQSIGYNVKFSGG
jgi:translation initiation factor 1